MNSPRTQSENAAGGKVVGTLHADAVRIFIYESVLDQVLVYSDAELQRERGGFLLGDAEADERVIVTGFVPAEHTHQQAAHLTFTHETWAHLRRETAQRFPGSRVVGWHHTHPGLGIFLSEYDRFIHRHFFQHPWQVAMVVDPRPGEFAFFQWRGAHIVDCGFVCLWGGPPHDVA
jgi:proteasome lid subunit RPN8/RPN11